MKLHEDYIDAIKFTLCYQIVLGFFSSMILDGGRCFNYVYISSIALWISTIILIIRHKKPSKTDILFIKFGYLAILNYYIFYTIIKDFNE